MEQKKISGGAKFYSNLNQGEGFKIGLISSQRSQSQITNGQIREKLTCSSRSHAST